MSVSKPTMHAMNSNGRRVSLLNDEPSIRSSKVPGFNASEDREDYLQFDRPNSYHSQGSSPRTPDLLRSDSYDSRTTHDPASPMTPSLTDFARANPYANSAYPDPTQYDQRPYANYPQPKFMHQPSNVAARPSFQERSSSSFDEERNPDRSVSGKRYPCRFKESHGCDKTFTTSGHASRHSKIHTAEKCVHCSFPGCNKKFTRADNMKQHLETHTKERSRTSSHKSSSSTSKLTVSAGINKPVRPSSRNDRPSSRPLDMSQSYAASTGSGQSPGVSPMQGYASLDMNGFSRALPSGLDALVDAVEYQSRN
jgi:uncharacterized Zn-finger protein